MNWDYVRNWGMILALASLGAALVWALGFAIYLSISGSRGRASTKRLLTSSLLVFCLALPAALVFKEGALLWALARGFFGSTEGQYQTGLLYHLGASFLKPNPEKAVAAFRRAAGRGHSQAQLALARACYTGRGTPQDRAEALRWARNAAQAGQPMAMVLAGDILQKSSPEEADPFFRQAAPLLRAQGASGDSEACFALGHLHRHGLGVTQDPVEALSWMLLARRLGGSPFQVLAIQAYEKNLSADQRSQARAQAEAWVPAKGKP